MLNLFKSYYLPSTALISLLVICYVGITSCTNDELQQDVCFGVKDCSSSSSSSSSSTPDDSDADGLSDDVEESIGTDPKSADTDCDGYADGIEYVGRNGDPLDNTFQPQPFEITAKQVTATVDAKDSDDDGLGDVFENDNELNENSPDTDRDGFSDGLELLAEKDPFLSSSYPRKSISSQTFDCSAPSDQDGDGLSNDVETILNTNAADADSDSDGHNDSYEYLMSSSPTSNTNVPRFDVPEPPASSSSSSSTSSSSSSTSSASSSSDDEGDSLDDDDLDDF